MTHDQRLKARLVYRAAENLVGISQLPNKSLCRHCAFLYKGGVPSHLNVSAVLAMHKSTCPLRIVIEAALGNTESEGA